MYAWKRIMIYLVIFVVDIWDRIQLYTTYETRTTKIPLCSVWRQKITTQLQTRDHFTFILRLWVMLIIEDLTATMKCR